MKKLPQHHHNSPSNAGFSLVELSITLVIISILVGASLSAIINQTAAAKKNQTIAKMDTIKQSLSAFLAINGRLPCPADSTLSLTNANFGLEYCTGTASKNMSGSLPTDFTQTDMSDTFIIQGTLPTKALQLPDGFMFDGWGNRFTFAITRAFAGTGTSGAYGTPTTPYYFGNTSTGLLTIKDAGNGVRTDQAVYMLVSHGANGFGAWTYNGNKQQPVSTNAGELENGPTTANFDQTFVQQEATSSFDDITHYAMKGQLVRASGAIISNTNCTLADNVINNSAICDNTQAIPDCINILLSFANQVNKWCIEQ